MTLEIGTYKIRGFSNNGFSLIEIILVLALIAIASSLIISNSSSLLENKKSIKNEDILLESIRYARIQAAKNQSIIDLFFDKDTETLIVKKNLNTLKTFLLNARSDENTKDITILFHLKKPANGLDDFETNNRSSILLNKVSFDSDRSSTPFFVTIRSESEIDQIIQIDPFSHYPINIENDY